MFDNEISAARAALDTGSLDETAKTVLTTVIDRFESLQTKTEAHINQRSEYVNALKNSSGNSEGAEADYYRWTGGAEARRQLAQDLDWTVPYNWGDKTAPKDRT
jgi:hypothetical protein